MLSPIQITRGFFRRANSWLDALGSLCRRFSLTSRFSNIKIHPSVYIGSGARFNVTDGGRLEIASGVYLGRFCDFTVQSGLLQIGKDTFVGPGCIIAAQKEVIIGCRVLIAEYCTIRDQDHVLSQPRILGSGFTTSSVYIADDCWLGAKATILKQSHLARGAVVAAHCVVKGTVEENQIVGGVPARVIGRRSCDS